MPKNGRDFPNFSPTLKGLVFVVMFLVSFYMAWRIKTDYSRAASVAFTAASESS